MAPNTVWPKRGLANRIDVFAMWMNPLNLVIALVIAVSDWGRTFGGTLTPATSEAPLKPFEYY
jgi:hypothetical protein